jgi:hypothetical protein
MGKEYNQEGGNEYINGEGDEKNENWNIREEERDEENKKVQEREEENK